MQNNEFQILHFYITGLASSDANLSFYTNGIENLNLELGKTDLEIQKFLIGNRKLFPIINMGVQIFLKSSVLRKRFLLGISIIECDKNFARLFLNSEKQKMALFKFLWLGFQTVCFGFFAFVLFKFKRWI